MCHSTWHVAVSLHKCIFCVYVMIISYHWRSYCCYLKSVWWSLAARCPEANKQATLVERKVCFVSDASNWVVRVVGHLSKGRHPLTGSQWGKSFYRQKGSYGQKRRKSALTVIFRLVIAGLSSVILIVWGTVNLARAHLFPFLWSQF